jgi:hypothetical protein
MAIKINFILFERTFKVIYEDPLQLFRTWFGFRNEVCTEKYRTEVFFVQTEPVGRGLYKKTEFRYFSVHTEQARLIKSLLYGIYRHLYLKQTRNA